LHNDITSLSYTQDIEIGDDTVRDSCVAVESK